MTCKASLTPELETLDYRAEKWMHAFVAAALLLWTSAILADGQTQTTKPAQAKAASAEPKPDLLVALPIPMNGTITVKNIGKARAAPSKVTLDCEKFAADGSIQSCPDLPPSVADKYFDPAFPRNATVRVPELAAGATFAHKLSFWALMQWPSGKYKFTAKAHADHSLPESNTKNVATSTLTVP